VTLQATGMSFFGLYGSTTALAATLTLSAVVNCIGIGFQRGTHTNWQLVQNDASGAPTLTDLGASFPVASTTNVLTLTLLAAPNSSEIGVRVVEEVSGAVVEVMLDTDIPAATQLLSPRNYMNSGGGRLRLLGRVCRYGLLIPNSYRAAPPPAIWNHWDFPPGHR
jgi:hypothetical protein